MGDAIGDIETPALMLDLDAFERNLAKMQAAVGALRLRPHAKSHKCPEIARRQIALGAKGICCQKLSEAAVFAKAGIHDILVTNQVIGGRNIQRLVELAQQIKLGVLVDDQTNVGQLATAFDHAPSALDVYVEVEVGGNRCGVAPDEVAELVRLIVDAPGLRFAGLHCYHGGAQHLRTDSERRAAIGNASNVAKCVVDGLKTLGIETPCVTGAGTGTFWLEHDSGVFTEIQAGSYALMDRDYARNLPGPDDIAFEHALYILSTVMSVSHDEFVVVDAGLKSMSIDSGMPEIAQDASLEFSKASDEHGIVTVVGDHRPSLGDTIKLIPGHCDPTVNLYDDLIVVQNGYVVDIWPIAARGASL